MFWPNLIDRLGIDFVHNDLAVRCWLAGCNPYVQQFGDPLQRLFNYPPIVLWTFAWTRWLSTPVNVRIWCVALIALVIAMAVVAVRERRRLKLRALSYPFTAAALLWAAPTIFAIERGNYDVLALAIAVAAVLLLRRDLAWADVLAGLCLAVAGWLKMYPFIILPGLLVLGRWRAAIWTVIVTCALALAAGPLLQDYASLAMPALIAGRARATGGVAPSGDVAPALLWIIWRPIWWTCMILPLVIWVSLRVRASAHARSLMLVYLVWLLAAGTQLPRVSHDYNLVALPLSVLMLWSGEEPPLVLGLLLMALLWWQPFVLWPRDGLVAQMVCKVMGLFAVAGMITGYAARAPGGLPRRGPE